MGFASLYPSYDCRARNHEEESVRTKLRSRARTQRNAPLAMKHRPVRCAAEPGSSSRAVPPWVPSAPQR